MDEKPMDKVDKAMDEKPMDKVDKAMNEQPMDKVDKAMKWGLNKTQLAGDVKYRRCFSSANLDATRPIFYIFSSDFPPCCIF